MTFKELPISCHFSTATASYIKTTNTKAVILESIDSNVGGVVSIQPNKKVKRSYGSPDKIEDK